ELTRTLSGESEGSLLAAIDCTITAAGARLLARRLAQPLIDIEALQRRLDSVSFFAGDTELRADIRAALGRVSDFQRALSRLRLGRGGPRDLASLRSGLKSAQNIMARQIGRASCR